MLGVVCIALVLMSGMIQAAHFHAMGQTDHDCTLCVAAHHVATVAAPIALDCSSLAVAPITVARSFENPGRTAFFRLASRPPPLAAVA